MSEFFDFTVAYCQLARSDLAIFFGFARENLFYAILLGTIWANIWALILCQAAINGLLAMQKISCQKNRLAQIASRWIIRARSRNTSYLIFFLIMMVPVIPYVRAAAIAGAQIVGLKSVLVSALFLNPARMMLLYLIILPLL